MYFCGSCGRFASFQNFPGVSTKLKQQAVSTNGLPSIIFVSFSAILFAALIHASDFSISPRAPCAPSVIVGTAAEFSDASFLLSILGRNPFGICSTAVFVPCLRCNHVFSVKILGLIHHLQTF